MGQCGNSMSHSATEAKGNGGATVDAKPNFQLSATLPTGQPHDQDELNEQQRNRPQPSITTMGVVEMGSAVTLRHIRHLKSKEMVAHLCLQTQPPAHAFVSLLVNLMPKMSSMGSKGSVSSQSYNDERR
jgi:hypothetical protein